jgi:hypothetical protein
MDDVKKYDSTSPLFAYIPKEVRKVLLHDFEDLLTDDFCTITKYDKLDPPEGIPLTTKYQQNEPLPPTSNPPDDLEDTQYLENLEREFILDDISDLVRGKEGKKKYTEDSSDEEPEKEEEEGSKEEEENEEGNWEGRLRSRRKVRFDAS